MNPLQTSADPTAGKPLDPARRPTGAGRAGVVGLVLAVLLLALAAALGREALVAGGAVAGALWTPAVLDGIDGLAPTPALALVGLVVALLGLWLLVTAFARRSRRAVAIQGRPSATTSTHDVARLATGAARRVDGVLTASSRAGRRSVDVSVKATSKAVAPAVEQAVAGALQALAPRPRVRVRVQAASAVDLPEFDVRTTQDGVR